MRAGKPFLCPAPYDHVYGLDYPQSNGQETRFDVKCTKSLTYPSISLQLACTLNVCYNLLERKQMTSFDTTSKKQVETNPQDFVHLRFKFRMENVTVLEVITSEQPKVEMHPADTLIKVLDEDREAFVHFEFQTADSYDPEMSLRMAGYIIRAIETYRLPVYSNVLYLGSNAGRNDPGKQSGCFREFSLRCTNDFRYYSEH